MLRFLTPTRRLFLETVGATALAAVVPSMAHADDKSDVPIEQLMVDQPLPDVVLGDGNAPVTIVEYASMTCPHCARFYAGVFPALKAKYIDTGKAKFILREFPLDPYAAAAALLIRCAGADKREALAGVIWSRLDEWTANPKPLVGLLDVVKVAGFTQDSFDSCLKNKDLYAKLKAGQDMASNKFQVDSTPTFFVNGKRVSGETSIDEFSKVIDPLLPK
ncbi:DsbA family protein [Methylovirgula sp. 4M-Z18]|uniref:DsbA family protein n=1 Tax=Methylovirgula sp. 4M-Z18 TaxID=2293567 RepID=UPI000E2E74A4|nr:DsbA family protein [Methylovirgula sp. 4M-Z18]RFB78876.1 DsbA family protein [Methylovirgula sp. 4M-Z18]